VIYYVILLMISHRLAFPSTVVWRIAREMAVGLEYLHNLKPPVIHLDIKSLNILLDASMTVKIADFGLSKISGAQTREVHKAVI